MSEELQSLVQIIELYGRGLGGLGKAIRFSAKGAAKGVQYLPISINVESLLLREEKDAYLFRIPRGRLGENLSSAIRIKKSDCILLDEGQTVITCLKREGDIWGY